MSDVAEKSAKTNAWPTGIFAITLFTENLEQAKEFYQNVFGLPIDYEDSNSAVFKFGDTLVNLLKITEAKGLIDRTCQSGESRGGSSPCVHNQS